MTKLLIRKRRKPPYIPINRVVNMYEFNNIRNIYILRYKLNTVTNDVPWWNVFIGPTANVKLLNDYIISKQPIRIIYAQKQLDDFKPNKDQAGYIDQKILSQIDQKTYDSLKTTLKSEIEGIAF